MSEEQQQQLAFVKAPNALAVGKAESVYQSSLLSLVPTPEQIKKFPAFPKRSTTSKTVKLKIANSTEQIEIPGAISTTIGDVRELLKDFLMVSSTQFTFLTKRGAYWQKVSDNAQVDGTIVVSGIKTFTPSKKKWPHPIGVIGAGYNGLKVAMTYTIDDDENFVLFDRNKIPGGYCWITGANKTSRLQTEFGSFHIWFGQPYVNSGKVTYADCNRNMNWMRTEKEDSHDPDKDGWNVWPYKWEMQKHFQYAVDRFGISSHINYETHVQSMSIVGDKNKEDRFYALQVDSLSKGKTEVVNVSLIYHFPGSLTKNRIIDYPGEHEFGGDIGYGMNDDTPYDKLKDSTIAIIGNGAFAVENARTALECGGVKAYIVTRRKNLACPRIPCWFVHQAPFPTPGGLLIQAFEKMYEISNFGDPWEYHSVFANAARTNVSVIQASRFGIGDVTFLMHAWGLLEYKVGVIKRMSKHTLHLEDGEALKCNIVLKALGLLGDWSVDSLHKMTEIVGRFSQGDWRRLTYIDATGMNFANIGTLAAGIGAVDFILSYKFMYDYPQEFYKAEQEGLLKALPRKQAQPEIEKPVYVSEIRHDMATGVTLAGMIPKANYLKGWAPAYKHKSYHVMHDMQRTLDVVTYEWDKYQADWKSRGIEHDYVPYPYTKEMVQGWADEYSSMLQLPVKMKIDGPTDEFLESVGGDVGKWGDVLYPKT